KSTCLEKVRAPGESPLAWRKSAHLKKGSQGGSVSGHPIHPDVKRVCPDVLCPGAPILTVSLRLHLLKRQTHRKYRTDKILFADVAKFNCKITRSTFRD